MKTGKRQLIASALALLAIPFQVQAADPAWPAKPVRFIVPGGPASAPDIVARIVANKLAEKLGAAIAIEPVAAAGGILAMQSLKNSPADGYTWALATSGMLAITPQLRKSAPYDVERDIVPVGLIGRVNNILVVSSALPVRDLGDFLAYARRHPGKLNYASTGVGSPAHIGGEALNQLASLNLVHIPYKGSAQALTDLAGNRVQVMVTSPIAARPYLANGKAKALAVASTKPDSIFPDLPTINSLVPGYELSQWFGIVVRAETPDQIVRTLQSALAESLRDPGVLDLLGKQGLIAGFVPSAEFRKYIAQQQASYGQIIRKANISDE